MIKAIVFDFAGVVAPGVVLQWVKKNLSADDPRYKTFQKATDKWDIGGISVDEFYLLISQITNISAESIQKELYDKSTYHTEIISIIKQLKPKYKIILFSNNFAHNLYKFLDKHNLRSLFDEIIISSEHKLKKPDPKFYKLMLSLTKVNNDEAIFIDDTQTFVDVGNKLGIKSLLYRNPVQLKADLKTQGVEI